MSGQDMRKLMEAIEPFQMIDKYTAVNGEKIYTDQTANVTPNRQWDWSAVLDSYDGAEDAGPQYMGMGATEDEAIADLNMQIQDQELDEEIVARPALPDTQRIAITYEIITPESAEAGDAEEHGWIDEEGVDMAPDKYDIDDGLTAVDKAVEFLRDVGATEASSSAFNTGVWYNAYNVDEDFTTNKTENRSYHLYGFSPEEEAAIYQGLKLT